MNNLLEGVLPSEEIGILKDALKSMGFFDAPASTKFHGDYAGGLYDHSFEVATALVELTEKMKLKWQDPRSPYLVGLLHDLCKVDAYTIKDDGTIVRNDDMTLTGHGDKSVILAAHVMAALGLHLTDEEVLCIRWHMGAFDEKENWKPYGKAIEKYPNVLYTHTADMVASKVLGI